MKLFQIVKQWLAKRRALASKKYFARLEVVFSGVKLRLPAAHDTSWLDLTQRAAERGSYDWKLQLHAYLVGLRNAALLGEGDQQELQRLIDDMPGPGPQLSDLLLYVVWALCCGTMAIAVMTRPIGWLFWAVAMPVLMGLGAWTAFRSAWLAPTNPSNWQRRRERIGGMLLFAIVTPVIAFFLPVIGALFGVWVSMNHYQSDVAAFSKDPEGFHMIQAFARKNHDIEVVLGTEDQSWLRTAAMLPGSSYASVSVHNGFCQMNLFRKSLETSWTTSESRLTTHWVQGIMIHELAHCLDLARDLPNFHDTGLHTHSIAPADAGAVHDIASYVAASDRRKTQRWREALADTMAVGFWRLGNEHDAKVLATDLRSKRIADAKSDQVHATACWIDQAMATSAPSSPKDLMAWADSNRKAARCEL